MELFYTKNIDGGLCFLEEEESRHCVKVLRHRNGDNIDVIDGFGTLLHGTIIDDNPRNVCLQITDRIPDWGGHPYRLDMAVCPPKNAERYDWFVEKVCEIGIDTIIPVIGDHSERRVLKTERLRKLAVSASKQSLKAHIPKIVNPLIVKDFIQETASFNDALKLFAFCFDIEEHPKISIRDALASWNTYRTEIGITDQKASERRTQRSEPISVSLPTKAIPQKPHIIIMIGPEGDFSPEEARLAMAHGFIPIHLGTSRLRTETAALLSAISVYTTFI